MNSPSTFLYHVGCIVRRGTLKEVPSCHARRIVATMEHLQIWIQVAIRNFKRDCMGRFFLLTLAYYPISLRVPTRRPFPTSVFRKRDVFHYFKELLGPSPISLWLTVTFSGAILTPSSLFFSRLWTVKFLTAGLAMFGLGRNTVTGTVFSPPLRDGTMAQPKSLSASLACHQSCFRLASLRTIFSFPLGQKVGRYIKFLTAGPTGGYFSIFPTGHRAIFAKPLSKLRRCRGELFAAFFTEFFHSSAFIA